MTSDQIKDAVTRKVLGACSGWATDEQRNLLENALRMALYRINLSLEESALSTVVKAPNEDYLKQFLIIKMVKGFSEKSVKAYTYAIRKFFMVVDRPVDSVTANDIRYFLAVRKTKDGVSNTTLDNELRYLRSFFTTLYLEELIPMNPTQKIEHIKQAKRRKEPFTELEVERIRKAVLSTKKRTPLKLIRRNVAIIEVLYSTGCRVGELVTMRRSNLSDEAISVIGKGDKERLVYLNPRAQMAITEYLAMRNDQSDWLFPNQHDEPISVSHVETIVRRAGRDAGIAKCHPHRFRRTAATIALRRGMPIDQVSRMLGHEQLTTTQIYAITADEEVQRSHQKYLT